MLYLLSLGFNQNVFQFFEVKTSLCRPFSTLKKNIYFKHIFNQLNTIIINFFFIFVVQITIIPWVKFSDRSRISTTFFVIRFYVDDEIDYLSELSGHHSI